MGWHRRLPCDLSSVGIVVVVAGGGIVVHSLDVGRQIDIRRRRPIARRGRRRTLVRWIM